MKDKRLFIVGFKQGSTRSSIPLLCASTWYVLVPSSWAACSVWYVVLRGLCAT